MQKIFIMLVLLVTSHTSYPAVLITARESGGDVVFTYNGTVDLSLFTFDRTINLNRSVINPRHQRFENLNGAVSQYRGIYFHDVYGPSQFGMGDQAIASSRTGDNFGVDDWLSLPEGYVSNTELSGSMTFSGHTFDSLGIMAGTYEWKEDSGTEYTVATLAAIPEPYQYTLILASGLLAFAFYRRFRLQKG